MKYPISSKASFILILLLGLSVSCTKPEKVEQEPASVEAQSENSEYSIKQFIDINMEELAKAKQGDTIDVAVEGDTSYPLQILRVEETMPGIFSFSANVVNAETGQANFILRDGKIAGSVSMYTAGIDYKLAYDDESGRHYITEVAPEDKDVLPGGEPLEAPRN